MTTMKTRLSLLLMGAAATVALAVAPSASAQVAVSGTFYGPHGAVRFNTGVPYGSSYGSTYYGDSYRDSYRDGYCATGDDAYYAPSYSYYDSGPTYYVRPVPRRYVYRNYARPYRTWDRGGYGHPYGGLRDGGRGRRR